VGTLIAVEGLDGSGKTALVDLLGRWLERRGRRVRVVPWERSRTLARAARDARTRPALTPTVAALIAAADATQRAAERVGPSLAQGAVVLADRYAWTGVARDAARGLDPAWVAALYAVLPPPDLVLYLRQDPATALERALGSRSPSVAADAIGAAFGDFLARLLVAFDGLATERAPVPWPAPAVQLDAHDAGESLLVAARDAVRSLAPGALS
jgi:dTMP kinase